jgi:hypothetical protein
MTRLLVWTAVITAAGVTGTAHARKLPAPPSGCRALNVRAMPQAKFVHARDPNLTTTTVVAGDRFIVFQTQDGVPERGEMFDPATDRWIEIASKDAPRYGSFKDGPGPLSGQRYFAFENWVVITWSDGNHHKRFSGAVFDAHANEWHTMSTAGMPANLGDDFEAGAAGVYVRMPKDGAPGHRYDIAADRWTEIPKHATRTEPAVGAGAGKVVVWGGILGEAHGSGDVLDLAKNTWRAMSTTGAPSGRYVRWSAARDGKLVTWSGASAAGKVPDLTDGGIYDIASDRWTPIPAANAPAADQNVDAVFLRWTGEALVDLEMPRTHTSNADPRFLAFWDPSLHAWWRSKAVPSWGVLPLGFGRLLVVDHAAPRVVHAREKLECPAKLPAFADHYPFTATALIGDELVIWTDTTEVEPCPRGTPCDRWAASHHGPPTEAGAVISP